MGKIIHSIENYQKLINNMILWQKAYDEGHPIISDQQWDEYYFELISMEAGLGGASPESPTQRIVYDVKNELQKVEHSHPMLSLDKTKDLNEIISFIVSRKEMKTVQELIAQLNLASYHYYNGLEPIMSDIEYDILLKELQKKEKESGIIYSNSPSINVGAPILSKLTKISIEYKPMLSLNKCHSEQEIETFSQKQFLVASVKLDGLSVRLIYNNGHLISANTRGNGIIGQDITSHIYNFINVPLQIPITNKLIVDGEALITKADFNKINLNQEFSNPRNLASGTLASLDTSLCAKRYLRFFAWDLIYKEGKTFSNYYVKMIELKNLGFSVTPLSRPVNNNFQQVNLELKEKANELSLPCDGIVWRYDDENYNTTRTEKFFNNAIAYKFYDELYETTLEDIEWSMGRTGVLTPVAIFKEIEIDGAKVSRASLHNIGIMNELLGQPFFGQKIRIFRANQIIPQVYDAENSPYTISMMRIKTCPICGAYLDINDNDGVLTLVCPNEACEGKLLNKLDHFCSKKGLDIKGLSKATLEKLMNWGWVEKVEDIFELHKYRQEWIKKEGFGVKSVDNILAAIDASKRADLAAFISSLGIPLIGLAVAKELVKVFDSYESFREAVAAGYDFSKLPNFGYEKTQSLLNFDYTSADIVRTYLFLTNENNKNTTETLKGLTICVTGKLQLHKNRTELKTLIEKNGGKLTESVSTKTNYLVNNDINSTSSKNVTAKKLGIPIITEQQLLDMLN